MGKYKKMVGVEGVVMVRPVKLVCVSSKKGVCDTHDDVEDGCGYRSTLRRR